MKKSREPKPRAETKKAKQKRLTPRVVRLNTWGWSLCAIGREVGVSKNTVKRWLLDADQTPNRTCVPKGAPLEERIALGTGVRDPKTGCVPWTKGLSGSGYGYVSVPGPGRRVLVHRALLEEKLGRALAPKELARHTCDNRVCINPDHLEPGFHKDNMQDMVDRQRHQFAYDRPDRVSLREQAFRLSAQGLTSRQVAAKVGVTQVTVCNWLRRHGRGRLAMRDRFEAGDRVWFRGHATRHIPAQSATVLGYRMSGDVHAELASGQQVSLQPNYFRRNR